MGRGDSALVKENRFFIDYQEWELLTSPIIINEVKATEEIDAMIGKIEISRDSSYKIKAMLEGTVKGLSNIRKKSGLPGEKVEVFTIEGTKHHGLIQYKLERCYLGDVHLTHNIFEKETKFKGELLTFQVNEIYSSNEVETLFDWYLNGPKSSFVFPRVTSRCEETMVKKVRLSVDDDNGKFNKFNSESSNLDFAFIDSGDYKFIISSVPPHYLPNWSKKIGIEYRKEWGIPNGEVRQAIGEFISFILGRQLLLVGTTKLDGDGNIVKRNAISPWGDNVVAVCQKEDNNPISFADENWGMIEQVVNQLLPNYLKLRDTLNLSSSLWRYWISRNMPIGTNLPVLSSAIEGLAKNWFKSKMSKTKGVYVDSKIFTELVGQEIESMSEKLAKIEHGEKIMNKIKFAYNMGANDRISFFFDEINLSIGEAEKEALKARNAMAHGDSSSHNDIYKLVKLTRVYETLFHRIILKLLGYEGHYIDRGTLGFPDRHIDEPSGEI
jgi:hypothetical protein